MTKIGTAFTLLLLGCGPAAQVGTSANPSQLMEPSWSTPDAGTAPAPTPRPSPSPTPLPIDCDAMYDQDEARCKAGPPAAYVACHTAARGRQGDCQQVK